MTEQPPSAQGRPRIVLMLGAEHRDFAVQCMDRLNVVGVIFEKRGASVKARLLWRRLLKQGPWRVCGQLLYRFSRVLRRKGGGGANVRAPALPKDVALRVSDINTPAVAVLLRGLVPDAVGVYGTSIIRGEVLDALPEQTFNLHTGLTEHYRGVCSSFWALYDDKPERIGVTIHRVGAGVDTGAVAAVGKPERSAISNVKSLAEIDRVVAGYGEGVFLRVLTGEIRPQSRPGGKGRFCTEPTLWEYRKLCRRAGLQ